MRLIFLSLVLMLSSLSAIASEKVLDSRGFYIGGQFGSANVDVDADGSSGSYSETVMGSAIYGGYNFNKVFGLEASMWMTGDLADDQSGINESGAVGFSIEPKFTFQVNRVVALYGKFGLTSIGYVEDPNGSRDENAWAGIGAGMSIGGQFSIVHGVRMRLNYAWSKASLDADDGNDAFSEYDLDLTHKAFSIGAYYQF